jgi:transcriptional regulator with XRE-family HTH domain
MVINADVFKRIRKVYDLSQKEFGDLLDISHAQVNRIERGTRNLTDRIRQRLVDELRLTPDKLSRILAIYDEFQHRRLQ